MGGHIDIADRCFCDLARHLVKETLFEAGAPAGFGRPHVRLIRRRKDTLDFTIRVAAPPWSRSAQFQLDLSRRLREGIAQLTGFRVACIDLHLAPRRA